MNKAVIIGIGVAMAFILGVGITVAVMMGNQSKEAERTKLLEDKLRAQQALEGIKSAKAKRMAAQAAAAARAEQARQEAQARAEAAAAEAAKPHYDPMRLKMAGQLKTWTNTTIPDYNINACLKTNWKDGRMNFRLALLGQREALTAFIGQWPEVMVTLTDQGGNNLHTVIVRTIDLQWAPLGANQGVPTLQIESNDEVALELYERTAQWNFNWQIGDVR